MHRDVQRHRHQGREEEELGRAERPERAAAADLGETPAAFRAGCGRGRAIRGRALHRGRGDEQQRRRRDSEGEGRAAPAKDRNQERGERGQGHLPGRGPDLRDPGHDPAPAHEPARDRRESRDVVGAHPDTDEERKKRKELPGFVNHRDERESRAEEQPRPSENRSRTVSVAKTPGRDREQPHDQRGEGGGAREQGPRPAELRLEDAEEDPEREKEPDHGELGQAGAEDDQVSRVHHCRAGAAPFPSRCAPSGCAPSPRCPGRCPGRIRFPGCRAHQGGCPVDGDGHACSGGCASIAVITAKRNPGA